MSKNEEKVSVEELRSKENNLYDFLYNDTRRIASFLSQVNELGYLQQVKESELSGSGFNNVKDRKIKVKIPTIINAELGAKVAPYEKEELNLEKTYDPLWMHAVNFLNYLENKKLLQKDIYQASLGQFVEVSGTVHLIDFEAFKEAFSSPTLFKNAGLKDKGVQQTISKIMNALPYSLQGHIIYQNDNTWFTLDKMFLTGQVSDIMLKYGYALNGIWKIIGILDVRPNEGINEGNTDTMSNDYIQNPSWYKLKEVINSFHSMLGRPENVASITPLLIYRNIIK